METFLPFGVDRDGSIEELERDSVFVRLPNAPYPFQQFKVDVEWHEDFGIVGIVGRTEPIVDARCKVSQDILFDMAAVIAKSSERSPDRIPERRNDCRLWEELVRCETHYVVTWPYHDETGLETEFDDKFGALTLSIEPMAGERSFVKLECEF